MQDVHAYMYMISYPLLIRFREENVGVQFWHDQAPSLFWLLRLLRSVLQIQRHHPIDLQHQNQRILHREKVVRVRNNLECKQSDEAHDDEGSVLHDQRHEDAPHFRLDECLEPRETRSQLPFEGGSRASEGAARHVSVCRKLVVFSVFFVVCFRCQYKRKLKGKEVNINMWRQIFVGYTKS